MNLALLDIWKVKKVLINKKSILVSNKKSSSKVSKIHKVFNNKSTSDIYIYINIIHNTSYIY